MTIKKILLTGQCTLHWGRMEYGNIGNYYILEPLLENLRKNFSSECEIVTTFQLTDDLSNKFNIKCLPIEYYFSFENQDINLYTTIVELITSYDYKLKGGKITSPLTDFMKEVISSDLVVQFDGDMWGDNAIFLGKDRFHIGLLKSIIMQNCNSNIVMIAGSPGPFNQYPEFQEAVKDTYKNFKIVTNRERISTQKLVNWGFNTANTFSLPCPSFLFQSNLTQQDINSIFIKEDINKNNYRTVGMVLCGWNMPNGPYNRDQWEDKEFTEFIKLVKHINQTYHNFQVVLLSHNNGFTKNPFKLIHGRDFMIVSRLYNLLKQENDIDMNRVRLIKNVYNAHETKGIISNFDFMISGRLHGSVAGLTSHKPTMMIKYANGPECHKLEGFADFIDQKDLITLPTFEDMHNKFDFIVDYESNIIDLLKINISYVQKQALKNFELLS